MKVIIPLIRKLINNDIKKAKTNRWYFAEIIPIQNVKRLTDDRGLTPNTGEKCVCIKKNHNRIASILNDRSFSILASKQG